MHKILTGAGGNPEFTAAMTIDIEAETCLE